MLPCGCEPSYEGGYGDDGKSGRYSMAWCPLHAAAADLLAEMKLELTDRTCVCGDCRRRLALLTQIEGRWRA